MGNTSYFQKTLVSVRYQNPKNSELKCVNITLSKTSESLKLLQNVLLKRAYFDFLPISKRKYDDLQSLTLRLLMSYIYMERLFLMFLDHTQRRTTVGRTPLDE